MPKRSPCENSCHGTSAIGNGSNTPSASTEFCLRFIDGSRVEAARVHAEAIRMRTRHVERFDAANRTEQVLGRVRVEAVRCQNIAARKQLEAIGGNHQVQVARLATHGAVAVGNLELGRCHHFESDATAMTTAGVCNHESPCSLRPMPPSLMPFM